MSKKFFEVFTDLSLKEECRDVFSEVWIDQMDLKMEDPKILLIRMHCDNLILRPDIRYCEREIQRQVLDENTNVHFVEHYDLSAQYTLANLLEVYKDSLLDECFVLMPAVAVHLKNARWEAEGYTLTLTTCKSEVIEKKLECLIKNLKKLFLERFSMEVNVQVHMDEQVKLRSENMPSRRSDEEFLEYDAKGAEFEMDAEGMPYIAASEDGSEVPTATFPNVENYISELSAMDPGQAARPQQKPEQKKAADGSEVRSESKNNKAEKTEKKEAGGQQSAATQKPATGGRWGRNARQGGKDGKSYQAPRRFRGVEGLRDTNDENSIYGQSFVSPDTFTPINTLYSDVGEVFLYGQVFGMDSREISNGTKNIVSFCITDFTDSIRCKMFIATEDMPEFKNLLKDGMFVEVWGICQYDNYDRDYEIASVRAIRKSTDKRAKRVDDAPVKRIELHCHTKMSEMDGVSDAGALVKQAVKWGHPALAITDHGVVHAFPDAMHALDKGSDFKVIYGVEAYLVDDHKHTVNDSKGQSLTDTTFIVFDIETTGFSPLYNDIIEIGAVKIRNNEVIDRFSEFINPKKPIPYRIEKLTSINDAMVMDAPTVDVILPRFLEFVGDAVLVAHNAEFDVGFIKQKAKDLGLSFDGTWIDTIGMARSLLPHLPRYRLDTVCKELGVVNEHHHRAVDDAAATALIFQKLCEMLSEKNITDVDALEESCKISEEAIKKLPMYHAVLLAASEVGRVNLYRMISFSHLKYFARKPRIPKSMLEQYREGILVGSACASGELFEALIRGESDNDLARIASYYDYLEIQPLGNNQFLIDDEDYDNINSKEDLMDLNRKVIALGEKLDKPVVATGDVHFLAPEDEIYRRIILFDKIEKEKPQPPLYFHTTQEMLDEFAYLGAEKAYEVVVTNTHKISDRIEKISPVRPDKCPPVIENSDQELRSSCYEKAESIYGKPLPDIVRERLDKELNSIISNGYSVMYIIARKLVLKSNADGYLVGSRGSVGSSLAATMSGITEVNPLSPHYYCPQCHYSDFDSEDVKKYGGGLGCGCDMPDKICPNCGIKMKKNGFDIPFETFLGFEGNKEPDIDLNFSGEYQSKAHAYTEVIFGEGHTFRAGTIATVADKTAYGYAKHYFDDHGESKRSCELDRIAAGCVGIRRSTGQHPGGIIVLPHGEEIYSFTPVQHPANDMTTNIITTHFDYHSIDHNLLKLDILGHDDPTMIRFLEDVTGLSAQDFPLDSPEVMSLFQNTDALGVKPGSLLNCKLGCLGIPEFGTDFAMQMVIDAKPTCFADLIRISGLSHGTDVWLGNAKTLIDEGTATIQTAICTRDDIMIYLISKGLEPNLAFIIMESVRKGKGLKPEWVETMTEHGVPDWYIWSCKKIKYMFPKAHAAAYVMMAWRIAYCKIFHPLAYYAAFFSIRAVGFSYEVMCMGYPKLKATLMEFWNRYTHNKNDLSVKEQDMLRDMRIVQEMYERGFDFMPIDIYRAKADRFQIIDGKLMPSFMSIEGMGQKAAEGLEAAAKLGPFVSKDDLKDRAKLSKTIIEKMSELGLLNGIPDSAQFSLFDGFGL